ncbi:uncharacterized protein [Antedon mediterranea]|uniref:uncharacterized protein isoform X2 n=1 Tax=Antedon mediterranea TaxID=105859 RepID=UPI003AF7A4AD
MAGIELTEEMDIDVECVEDRDSDESLMIPEEDVSADFPEYPWFFNVEKMNSKMPQWVLHEDIDQKSRTAIEKMLLEEHLYSGKCVHTRSGSSKHGKKKQLFYKSKRNVERSDTHRMPWSDEEQQVFNQAREIHGNQWSKIADMIPTRTPSQVKNHAAVMQKKSEMSDTATNIRKQLKMLTPKELKKTQSHGNLSPKENDGSSKKESLKKQRPSRSPKKSGKNPQEEITSKLLNKSPVIIQGEAVKIQKLDSDEDVDIDVEMDSDDSSLGSPAFYKQTISSLSENSTTDCCSSDCTNKSDTQLTDRLEDSDISEKYSSQNSISNIDKGDGISSNVANSGVTIERYSPAKDSGIEVDQSQCKELRVCLEKLSPLCTKSEGTVKSDLKKVQESDQTCARRMPVTDRLVPVTDEILPIKEKIIPLYKTSVTAKVLFAKESVSLANEIVPVTTDEIVPVTTDEIKSLNLADKSLHVADKIVHVADKIVPVVVDKIVHVADKIVPVVVDNTPVLDKKPIANNKLNNFISEDITKPCTVKLTDSKDLTKDKTNNINDDNLNGQMSITVNSENVGQDSVEETNDLEEPKVGFQSDIAVEPSNSFIDTADIMSFKKQLNENSQQETRNLSDDYDIQKIPQENVKLDSASNIEQLTSGEISDNSENEDETSKSIDHGVCKSKKRYLFIRNLILRTWESHKQNYMNCGVIRNILKKRHKAGNVNDIGCIHKYLEKAGAINVGLENPNAKWKPKMCSVKLTKEDKINLIENRRMSMRPKRKKDAIIMEENDKSPTVRVSRTQPKQKAKSYDPFKLIACSKFSNLTPAPLTLKVTSKSLVVMDIHAHLSGTEVIGLLGGCFNQSQLTIQTAVPCNSLSTGMQCEMDPVSQTEACEAIIDSGLQVVGWYHSHPTFPPNPSVRDIETQSQFQSWFVQGGAPFVGVIVNPYSRNFQNESEFRFMIICDQWLDGEMTKQPFQFDFDVVHPVIDVNELITVTMNLLHKFKTYSYRIEMMERYRRKGELTYLEKMLLSLKKYLLLDGGSLQIGLIDKIREMVAEEFKSATTFNLQVNDD